MRGSRTELERKLQALITLRSARAAIQRVWKAAYLKCAAADRQRGMHEDMEEEPVESARPTVTGKTGTSYGGQVTLTC